MAMSPAGWFQDARQYLTEVQSEYKKITWPAQKEAVTGAIGVVVIVVIITIVLAIVDFALGYMVRWVLG